MDDISYHWDLKGWRHFYKEDPEMGDIIEALFTS
jgi:hypothetical protein